MPPPVRHLCQCQLKHTCFRAAASARPDRSCYQDNSWNGLINVQCPTDNMVRFWRSQQGQGHQGGEGSYFGSS